MKEVLKGSLLYSNKFGTGEVERIFNDGDLMLVRFNSEAIPIMCSKNKMTTVHDNNHEKLRLILST